VAHRTVLKEVLAGEWGIAIERNGRGPIQLNITKRPYGRGRRGAVGCQQGKSGFLGHAIVFFSMVVVYLVDNIPRHTGDRLTGGEGLRQLDLNRIPAGDVMYNHADSASVTRKACLPLSLGKCRRKCGEGCGACFEASARASDRLFIFAPYSKKRLLWASCDFP
jgi:hypothetical protein